MSESCFLSLMTCNLLDALSYLSSLQALAPIGGIFFGSSTMDGYMARRLGVYGISLLIPTL
jgi:hypothetical protein